MDTPTQVGSRQTSAVAAALKLEPGDQPSPELAEGLVEALTSAYASLLRRQRTASSAYVRWNDSARSHDFAWLPADDEIVMTKGANLLIESRSPIHSMVNKMMATLELNPYEREVLYGYPYIIGFIDGKAIRAPLFTVPITIASDGGRLIVSAASDGIRFNSLPYRTDNDTAAHEHALAKLIDLTPEFPLTKADLRHFCEGLERETGVCIKDVKLDGIIAGPPAQPRKAMALRVIDAAACFIAPKAGYFLVSDLGEVNQAPSEQIRGTALGWLLGKRPAERTTDNFSDDRSLFFPFPSNPSQRRVAHLVDDPNTRITVVQGPPGTGKSLTIANLACHLVASGKRVLITSQKDKALDVVDGLLRQLELPQLPMTLLRQDKESKKELRGRLDKIQKGRSSEEARLSAEEKVAAQQAKIAEYVGASDRLLRSLMAEHSVERASIEHVSAKGWFRKLHTRWKLGRERHRANRHAEERSDLLGDTLRSAREQLLSLAEQVLATAAEYRTCNANKNERNQLREFAKLLGRDERNYRNYKVFDRLKSEPERCRMLLEILPCWILTPDDVARLFPCQPGLFDVVIIDEASQCDLPSMTPVLYRAKKAVVAGDSRQMQAQRFAFTSSQVAAQAWAEQGLDRLDPDRWLDPGKVDLLQLASLRMDEEAFLDEHYRSLPAIIGFSNHQWYGDRLRLMRDHDDKRVGDPGTPPIVLHRVKGAVEPGTQENPVEAKELVRVLRGILDNPGYSDASIGIICLFEEQMRLVNDLVAESTSDEERVSHQIVVVNPDGFQGDERDVILYSLSYDAEGMTRSQLSARQADREHIQGMLNVAFTRARDEIHVFHSANISEFGTASGTGTIKDWLEHCDRHSKQAAQNSVATAEESKCQSLFEAEVLSALRDKGARVISQYPSCGYFIDIVAELDGVRLAIECDGELFHLDEHGQLRPEDVHRQEVLERAGWDVVRIPYRSWQEDSQKQVERLIAKFSPVEPATVPKTRTEIRLIELEDKFELGIVNALVFGNRERYALYRTARQELGFARLGPLIREGLDKAVLRLQNRGIIKVEEGEIFFADDNARNASYAVGPSARRHNASASAYRGRSQYRRW